MFESRDHKINYLIKINSEKIEKICSLLKEIVDNEKEIIRLFREVS